MVVLVRITALLLLTGVCHAAAPVLSMVACDSPSSTSVRCNGIGDIAGSHILKVYVGGGGALLQTVTRTGVADARTHSVIAGGLPYSNSYDLELCSDSGSGTGCATKQTVSTGAAPASTQPTAPTAVDNSWTSGTVGPVDVGADCNDATTGLQARYDAAANNTKIRIPTTTTNCTTMLVTSAAKTGIEITTDSTNRPPPGVRDSSMWGHSKWYRAWFDFASRSSAEMAALTGKVSMNSYPPGSIAYEYLSPTWNLKKAALAGSPVVVTNATNATPIVVTTSTAHGFSNGDAVCIDSVLGNLAANGCFRAANVSTFTLELKLRDGTTSQAGSAAYTSGGQLQGLSWTVISPDPSGIQAGPLSGSCAASGIWGHDTTATYFTFGMFRCGTDLKWYRIHQYDDSGADADGVQYTSAINMAVNATKIRITGIDFADVPIDPEPEYAYGPRNGAYGATIGTVYQGGRGTDRVDLDQNIAMSDLTKWRMILMHSGVTTNMAVRNSSMSCGGYHLVYISEVEMPCNMMAFENSNGPILDHNNYGYIGGWFWFSAEPSTFVRHQNITISENYILGVLNFAYGTPYYNQATRATQPITQKTRQLVEFKTGANIEVSGNVFDGLAYSVSPVAAAISMGTQTGYTNTITINSSGVVGVNAQRPLPLSLSANEKMMLFDNSSGDPAILRIDNITANVITLKNLDGTAYSFATQTYGSLCSLDMRYEVSDANVHDNTFLRVGQMINTFGNSYSYGPLCQPGPANRMRIANNFYALEAVGQVGGYYGTNTALATVTGPWPAGLVDYVQVLNNTGYTATPSNSIYNAGFVSDTSTTNFRNYGLDVQNNILPGEDYGVYNSGGVTGTTVLDARWPEGWTYTHNAVTRSGGSIGGEPAGQTYPTVAGMGWSSPATGNYYYNKASVYRYTSSDAYPAGHDIQTLNVAQGRVSAIMANPGTGTATFYWSYDGGAACTVDASTTSAFTTYTRGTSATAVRRQSKALTLAAGRWYYQVLCPGTVDAVVTGTVTVR